jgi:serine/threonine-protein kinase
MCDVLDYAHKRGFVHGDLRPENIMVTPEGQIKIADFWVNPAVDSQRSVRTSTIWSSIRYMAPEVAEGKPATAAADIYSLGVLLFELLTGTVPFDGDTSVAIALKHARDPIPSMRTYNPAVPKTLEGIVARALQKEPEERFRSVKSMLNELKTSREALHLSKPLVWSETTDMREVEPALESGETRMIVDQRGPRWMLSLRAKLLILVLLLAIGCVIGTIMLVSVPADVKLPDLVGMKFEDAQSQMSRSKVDLTKRSEEYNESFPEGVIFYMSPSAGRTIKSGKSVEVWVSKGSKYAMTPNLLKLSSEDAAQRVVSSGLIVGEMSQDYDALIPSGSVISQKPAPGTKLERGKPVSFVSSLGPKPSEAATQPPEGTTNPEENNTTPGNSGEAQNTQSSTSKPRSLTVKLTVPEGPQQQMVEIQVTDDNGERTAYSEVKHPGDKVSQKIQVVGSPATVRIYLDEKLVKEESL